MFARQLRSLPLVNRGGRSQAASLTDYSGLVNYPHERLRPDLASVMTTTVIPPVLKTLKAYLLEEYQDRLDRVILFGSQARQQATPDFDLDVLIVLNDPVNPSQELCRTSQFIAELCLEHNLLISRLFLSRSRFETENSPLLRNIRQEGIAL